MDISDYEWPYAGSCFRVTIDGSTCRFQEVSGLEVSTDVEEIKEGGLWYVHRVPGRAKYPPLVLKRGVFDATSDTLGWVIESLQMGMMSQQGVKTKDVLIELIDENGSTVLSWAFAGAYPIKWSMGGFNSMENAIAVENLELAYSEWF